MEECYFNGSRLESFKEKRDLKSNLNKNSELKKGFWVRFFEKQVWDKKKNGKEMNLSKANVGTPLTVRSEDDDGDKINTSLKLESDSFDVEALSQNSFCSSYIGSVKSAKSQTATETQRNEGTRKLFFEGNDRIVPMNLRINEFDIMHSEIVVPQPIANSIAAECEISPSPNFDDSIIATMSLPKNLITVGMYASAVTLLTDERFINKRIQLLRGNIDKACRHHMEDVVYLVHSYSPKRCHKGIGLLNEEGLLSVCKSASTAKNYNCSSSLLTSCQNVQLELKETVVDIYHKFILSVISSLDSMDCTRSISSTATSSVERHQQLKTEGDEESDAVIARVFYFLGQSLSNDFGWKEESMELYKMYILNNILNDEGNSESNTATIARRAKIFRAIGDIHVQRNNSEEALSAYEYAQNVIEEKSRRSNILMLDMILSSIHLRIGDLHFKQGSLADALRSYNLAHDLELSCQIHKGDVMTCRMILRQISYTLHNIGVVRRHMEDLEGALHAFVESVNALEEAAEDTNDSAEDELRRATTFNNMAGVLRRLGRFGESFLLYKEALRIKKDHLSESHPSVSLTLAAMASTLRAGGQEHRARKYYKAAMK
jgi:tetratricopeptide (TPR) repeat protein